MLWAAVAVAVAAVALVWRRARPGRILRGVSGREYRVGKRLATGGMAEVFCGYEVGKAERDPWAIKILSLVSDDSAPLYLERFQREIEIGRVLDHAGLIRVIDWGEISPQQPFLIMERVDGRSLRQVLRATAGPQFLPRALRWADELLSILASAHAASIIHRDVKPENILVTPDDHLKLIDFGIARHLDLATLTATAAVMGTPVYMSPEHFEARSVTPQSDLYSVGSVLYEMLAGAPPYEGAATPADLTRLLEDVMTARVVPLRERNPAVPDDVRALVEGLMQPEPSRRFPDAAAARAALAPLLAAYR